VQKTSKNITLKGWCQSNGYPGVTKQCILNAFNSDDPNIQHLAKREKLKGMIK
tara:strand:+ start:132 stop:290 length:159 start_codon:yes stop_codon:yes gene_type:complete